MDALTAISDKNLSDDSKVKISTEMINIVRRQIFDYNMYCLDIKPNNFVVNLHPFKVRMIDFGADWCTFDNLDELFENLPEISKKRRQILLYLLILMQLYLFIKKWCNIPIKEPFMNDAIFSDRIVYQDELYKVLKYSNNLFRKYHDLPWIEIQKIFFNN